MPPGQLPQLPTVAAVPPGAAPVQGHTAKNETISAVALAAGAVSLLPPSLTQSQRGELELAKTRAERAAAGRSRAPGGGGGGAGTAPVALGGGAVTAPGGGGGGALGTGRRHRGGGEASLPNSDDEDGGDHSDGELELSRLSPEEQERVLTARLAGGGGGAATDKDARRLKRCVRIDGARGEADSGGQAGCT